MTQFTRAGYSFDVVDKPLTSSWGFWGLWANGSWEKELHKIVDSVLGDDGLLIDVGAWVGPISLWAARLPARRVIALEPDPEAFAQLAENVVAHPNILALPFAAANDDGHLTLHSLRDGWGQSTSSLVFEGGESLEVRTLDIVSLVEYVAPFYAGRAIMKMDTEGGEALVFNRLGPVLRRFGIPLLLSIHVGWPHLLPEWDEWDNRDLRAAGHSYYLTAKT
jgi:FkbM family methyltransferase